MWLICVFISIMFMMFVLCGVCVGCSVGELCSCVRMLGEVFIMI